MDSDTKRMIFGFALLAVIVSLAVVIALGKVEKDTSHGLELLLGCLATLSGGFAQWAFSGGSVEKGRSRTTQDEPEEPR